jgi:hypothetical protein
MERRTDFLTSHPAVIAVWAALIAAVSLVPAFPIIGTGATFSVSAALVPLAGIFFGPIPGAVCVAIGIFIGQLIAPHIAILGPLTFVIPALNALAAGFAMRKKWYVPLGLIILLSGAWYLFPLGRAAWFQPLVWSLGVIASLIGWFVASNWIGSDTRSKRFIGVFLAALAGTIVDHAIGCIWYLALFKLPREVWLAVLPLAPFERILFALGAAIIGTPLLFALPRIGVLVGQSVFEEDEEVPL